ncbi:MAG: hypothetical protein JNL58_06455 [Planctomyces sp.]|nr:hypothetical protein [Planctomyces sp.]
MASTLETLTSFFRLSAREQKGTRRNSLGRKRRIGLEELESRLLLTNPLTSIPQLNSFAGAPVTIYLDFDGHTETQDWPGARTDGQSGPVVTPVFDIDNDFTTFSDTELQMIEEVWYRVAEDYAPFRVNVTTVDPGTYNNFEAVLVSIGGDGAWIGSPGGIAWIDSFSNGLVNTTYVFSDNTGRGGVDHMKGTAMAVSHEVGHMLGLLHHSVYDAGGNKTAEYDPGSATLGPIMGAPYGSERETWANAPDSNGVNSIQDDLAVMTRAANQTFALRNDDTGNIISTARKINVTTPAISQSGRIERPADSDFFEIETNTGDISFSVTGLDLRTVFNQNNLNPGTNLDLVLRLYSSTGVLIAEDNPTNSLFASVSASVAVGKYYVQVTTTGEYGALGNYTLTGNVIPLPTTPSMIGPSGLLTQPVPVFEWTVGANAFYYELQVDNLTTGRAGVYVRNVTGSTTHQAEQQFTQGNYQARVRTVAADGSKSEWSNFIQFTIDIPTPAKPIMTRPVGELATSFPEFIWNPVDFAASYDVWVNNFANGQRVIYRTNNLTTAYKHFNPLADGTYRAWVRATNSVGEASPWSDFVEFSIDAPTPVAPTITAPTIVTNNVNPRIVWTQGEDVWKYDLWVDYRNAGISQYIRDTNIQGKNFYDPAALPQGTYVAWVRARNGNDEVSGWSAPYTFTVDILPPGKPKLTAPIENGSTKVTSANPEFRWNAVDRGAKYDLWVNNVTTGVVQFIREQELTGTSFTSLTSLTQGSYKAWIRAKNSAGEVGPWSDEYSFSVDDPTPSIPVFTGPAPNTAGSIEDSTPTFTWTFDVHADFYDLWIDNNTLQKSQVVRVPMIVGESYTVPDALRFDEHRFTAWVRAGNTAGEFSEWSNAFRFVIDVPNPSTPEIIGPNNTIRTKTPTFEWVHSSGSVRYEIMVRDLERQENIVLNVRTFQVNPAGTIASYTLPSDKALTNGTYRFWIRAFNSQGTASAWSASKTFAIQASLDSGLTIPNADPEKIELTALLAPLADEPVVSEESSSEGAQPEVVEADLREQAEYVAVMSEIADPSTSLIGEFLMQQLPVIAAE